MEKELIQGILGATFFILFAILITITFVVKYYKSKIDQKSKLLEIIIQVQEDERQRVAMDIHDGLGALLRSVKFNLDVIRKLPELRSTSIGDKISENYYLIAEAVLEARNASKALAPEAIRKFGLKGALNDLVIENSKYFKIALSYECFATLNEIMQVHIFRILSELFNNSIKYSNASEVVLNIYMNQGKMIVYYSDNGVGFNFNKIIDLNRGNGLKNIQNRVNYLEGEMYFEHNSGAEFKFIFTL